VKVVGPAAAAMGEVLAVGDQSLVEVAGEQRNALRVLTMPAGNTGAPAARIERRADRGAVAAAAELEQGLSERETTSRSTAR